jgi:hypothetical protein
MKVKHSLAVIGICMNLTQGAAAENSQELNDPKQSNITSGNSASVPVVTPDSQNFASAWGVAAQVGTLGLGFNLAHALYSDYLNARFQANYATFNTSLAANGVTNTGNLNWNTYGLLLDYQPFAGIFRVTGGIYYDNRSLQISGGNIQVGDNLSGSGNAGINFAKWAPYLGIGVGSTAASSIDKKGFLINFDAGLLFQDPTAYANLTCNASTPQACANFNQQKNKWVSDMQNGLNAYGKVWPVLSLGLGYRF